MKKKRKIIIYLVLIIAFYLVNIVSELITTEYYITTTILNVRSGAGTGYSVLFTLQEGEEIEIVSKDKNWYLIRKTGNEGYVYAKYLKYSRTDFNSQLICFHPISISFFSIIILLVGIFIFKKIQNKKLLETVTNKKRGTRSERDFVLKLLKSKFPAQTIFHDLYLKKKNNEYSQIDLVTITKVGIIVIEVKDYSGWIFGDGNSHKWTQVLAYGNKKFRFYNPIKQNKTHINELIKKIGLKNELPFYSLIIFYGNCKLKNIDLVPKDTYVVKSNKALKTINLIIGNNEAALYPDEYKVITTLKDAVKNGESEEIRNDHIKNVKNKQKNK